MVMASKYLTSEHHRLSKSSVRAMKVIRLISFSFPGLNISFNFENCQDEASCVRWNPNGDILAGAFNNGTVKLIDFKTGKFLWTRSDSYESDLFCVYFLILGIRSSYVCLFHLKRRKLEAMERKSSQ